jgi:hypothetical protein
MSLLPHRQHHVAAGDAEVDPLAGTKGTPVAREPQREHSRGDIGHARDARAALMRWKLWRKLSYCSPAW